VHRLECRSASPGKDAVMNITVPKHPRRVLPALAVAAALCAGPVASAQADGPVASAARACSLAGSYSKLGPTYAYQLKVTATSCSTGKRVIRAWHSCRLRSGGRKGHCHHSVLHFACTEARSTGFASFVARVRCHSGVRRVSYVYNQNF
jgi:hypothetical protein